MKSKVLSVNITDNQHFRKVISFIFDPLIPKTIVLIFFISTQLLVAQTDVNDSRYLESTEYIDCDNEVIVNKALELTKGCKTESDKLRAIFEFVRDSYTTDQIESYKASDVLKYGGNSCHQRANLLAALCRAANLPSRRHLQLITIKDYKYQTGEIKDLTFTHGITGVKLNGKWYLYEPVGNSQKWDVWNQTKSPTKIAMVEFVPDEDCLYSETDKIKIETVPLYFLDHTDFLVEFRGKLIGNEIGF